MHKSNEGNSDKPTISDNHEPEIEKKPTLKKGKRKGKSKLI